MATTEKRRQPVAKFSVSLPAMLAKEIEAVASEQDLAQSMLIRLAVEKYGNNKGCDLAPVI